MKILLGGFNAKVGREGIFKSTIGNESIHRNSTDKGVRIVTLPHKKQVVKSTMFPLRNIHKYTWSTPDGKTTRFITYCHLGDMLEYTPCSIFQRSRL
jgi:hypothetical protein